MARHSAAALAIEPDFIVQPPMPDPLAQRYAAARAGSLALCEGLSAEDCQLQAAPEASPVKWQLAHTTWFFDTFVLPAAGLAPLRPQWSEAFNSYYVGAGARHPQALRHLLSRPSLDEVRAWRAELDAAVAPLLMTEDPELAARIELGIAHEQQHQELILTDLKLAFAASPLRPTYREGVLEPAAANPARWLERPGVMVEIGADPSFAFDHERPRHRVWLDPHALASRPVSNAEFRAFIEDGGYARPDLWLSDGWAQAQAGGWQRPLYWSESLDSHFTLRGEQPIDPHAPVCHLSWFEADAYARWAGARLPREAEWEAAAAAWPVTGNFADSGRLHPLGARDGSPGYFGDVWEWTASSFDPYPGYRAPAGALGEYNGKFMSGQRVLRGGSCASPAGHLRASYRNFFPPQARWQFSGLRLAKDLP